MPELYVQDLVRDLNTLVSESSFRRSFTDECGLTYIGTRISDTGPTFRFHEK